jgi:hypothetical protein
MLNILSSPISALVILALLIILAGVTIHYLTFKRSNQPPEKARGPFTRPTQPADPSTIQYNWSNHIHMQPGTVYESMNEHEGVLPVRRTIPIQTNLSVSESLQRALREAIQTPAAPGVRVVHVTESTQLQREREVRERHDREQIAKAMQAQSKPKQAKEQPSVGKRKDRYHRDPVV